MRTTFGPELDCVRQVDCSWRVEPHRAEGFNLSATNPSRQPLPHIRRKKDAGALVLPNLNLRSTWAESRVSNTPEMADGGVSGFWCRVYGERFGLEGLQFSS